MNNFIEKVTILVRARYPLVWLETYEETRAIQLLEKVAREQSKKIAVWSVTSGLTNLDGISIGENTQDPVGVLTAIKENKEQMIVVLKDLHKFLPEQDTMVYRKLRDLYDSLKATSKTIFILSPIVKIPTELSKSITVLTLPLPEKDELESVLQGITDGLEEVGKAGDTKAHSAFERIKEQLAHNGTKDAILSAGLGLTLNEFEDVLTKSLVQKHEIDISVIISEKEQIIKKAGMLEFYSMEKLSEMADVGGLKVMKTWIQKRKLAYSAKAKAYGLKTPKGIMLIGFPGTGKSLFAKVAAKYMQMPLIRLDMSEIASKWYGETTNKIKQALMLSVAIAPCIFWWDEVEKMFGSTGQGTHEETMRAISTILTWMQELDAPVFIIATCLSGDTIIQLADGSFKEIRSLTNEDIILSWDFKSRKIVQSTAIHKVKRDAQATTIITRTSEITATPEHKFYKLSKNGIEIVHVSELKEGDYIAAPKTIPIEGKEQELDTDVVKDKKQLYVNLPKKLTPKLSWLVGYICGDGGLCGDAQIRATDSDKNLLETYCIRMYEVFGQKPKILKTNHSEAYYAYSNSIVLKRFFERNFPEAVGKNRSVPKIIQRSTKENVAAFVQGIFDAEGTVTGEQIQMVCKDKQLILGISMLLQRFGIAPHFRETKGGYRPDKIYYRLTIAENSLRNEFLNNIGFTSERKQEKLKNIPKRRVQGRSIRSICPPTEVVERLRAALNISKSELKDYTQKWASVHSTVFDEWMRVIHTKADGFRTPYTDVTDIYKKELSKDVEQLENIRAIRWDKIIKISENKKETEVYDIHVPPHENFIAQGYISHNCNDPFALNPALMRAGRFDEVFYVDLPNQSEREEIFRIHIQKVKRNPESFDVKEFAEITNEHSGAEIEACVQDALNNAFFEDTEITSDHIVKSIRSTVPLSKKREDDLKKLREWGKTNAVSANEEEIVVEKKKKIGRKFDLS